jgi:uncharacterized UPF0160 family protein
MVLACWMFRSLTEFKQSQVIRTKDPELHDACELLADVGAELSRPN